MKKYITMLLAVSCALAAFSMLFRALEEEQPNHVAVKQYKVFKQAAGVICSK